jgi:hypothetical protein
MTLPRLVTPTIIVATIWLSSSQGAGQTPTSSTQIPIAFEEPKIFPADDAQRRPARFAITLRNTGDRLIVAWGVSVEIRHANGRVSQRGRMTDSIEMLDLDTRGVPILPPNGSYTLTDYDAPGPDLSTPVDVAATATYVIFADDTAIGDEKLIADRFENRALRASIWLQAEQALQGALRAGGSPEQTLRAADALLEGVTDPAMRNSVTFAAARRLLAQGSAGPSGTGGKTLERLRHEIPKRRQALQTHLSRRK